MSRIGADLINQSKASQDGKSTKSPSRGDLISLLIEANTLQDLPESQQIGRASCRERVFLSV